MYKTDNREFKIAMTVGAMIKCFPNANEWRLDIEIANMAYYISNKLDDGWGYGDVLRELERFIYNPNSSTLQLPNANMNDNYINFWYGSICGNQFGFPTEENLRKSKNAIHEFQSNMEYRYLEETILDLYD